MDYDRIKYYETIAAALEQSPSVMAAEAAAAIRNLAERLTDEERDGQSYRARLATMQNRLDSALMDVVCGNVETVADLDRAENALRQIKALVCGDRNQRWLTDAAVTSTRGWIADLCDAALAAADRSAPDWDDLRGVAPDATGDQSSEAFIREQRDSWER